MSELFMIPDQIAPIVAEEIVSPVIAKKGDSESLQGQHSHGVRPPNVPEIERLVAFIIAADGDWVLFDRNRASRKYNDSSARNNALRRRGFEVTSRHVQGVRNYWARWTHPTGAEVPNVPLASTDGPGTAYGILLSE